MCTFVYVYILKRIYIYIYTQKETERERERDREREREKKKRFVWHPPWIVDPNWPAGMIGMGWNMQNLAKQVGHDHHDHSQLLVARANILWFGNSTNSFWLNILPKLQRVVPVCLSSPRFSQCRSWNPGESLGSSDGLGGGVFGWCHVGPKTKLFNFLWLVWWPMRHFSFEKHYNIAHIMASRFFFWFVFFS